MINYASRLEIKMYVSFITSNEFALPDMQRTCVSLVESKLCSQILCRHRYHSQLHLTLPQYQLKIF